ncbi:MAG TPA: BON domain-containing protein [Gammaproteobacteria bacterium]|jgi:osmotically-inducible protein OsmY|nr:BON domain-containing protein [Gammaproteobacteria bacterium]
MRTDTELRLDVIAELQWDSRINSNEIGVIVKDAAVTLTGMVETYAEKLAAERAAMRVRGVRAVADNIEVRLPSRMRATDEGLAEEIARILRWTATLRDTSVQAEVRGGRVTLSGEVESFHQRETAVAAVTPLEGVVSVVNCITVRPPAKAPSARDIQREIMGALHRHASVEASNIRVSVDDGRVTLEGRIDAHCEREAVREAARATAGVKEVVDKLVVARL